MPSRRIAAFTLLELTIVVLIMSLLATAVFRYSTQSTTANNTTSLTKTLDAIETALQNYRNTYDRLPCPADITLAENSTNFGVEVGTPGNGACTGMNFNNTAADPDGGTNGQAVAGSVPTKTLRIDDKYAYDPWGRKILFVVDKRATATAAFTTYSISSTSVGTIVIRRNSTDAFADAITDKGIYALVSYGVNGHGGYTRSGGTTSLRLYTGSSNANELKNCHCDDGAAPTTFDRIFIQSSKAETTIITNNFDDVVRFKTRAQLASYAETQ